MILIYAVVSRISSIKALNISVGRLRSRGYKWVSFRRYLEIRGKAMTLLHATSFTKWNSLGLCRQTVFVAYLLHKLNLMRDFAKLDIHSASAANLQIIPPSTFLRVKSLLHYARDFPLTNSNMVPSLGCSNCFVRASAVEVY